MENKDDNLLIIYPKGITTILWLLFFPFHLPLVVASIAIAVWSFYDGQIGRGFASIFVAMFGMLLVLLFLFGRRVKFTQEKIIHSLSFGTLDLLGVLIYNICGKWYSSIDVKCNDLLKIEIGYRKKYSNGLAKIFVSKSVRFRKANGKLLYMRLSAFTKKQWIRILREIQIRDGLNEQDLDKIWQDIKKVFR